MNSLKTNEEWIEKADYKKYVGPQKRYDYFAGLIFKLLFNCGLKAHHTLLDIGAGSLRAGKMFIVYLNTGNYHAIEPNEKILQEGIKYELGNEIIRLKQPEIQTIVDLSIDKKFNYILAHSIFTHTGRDLLEYWIKRIKNLLIKNGTCISTFHINKHGPRKNGWLNTGWSYPETVFFYEEDIGCLLKKYKLSYKIKNWEHPSQTWMVITHETF